jgi:membrane-associated protease RseP (regulator of RpoE activity)
MNVLRSTRFPWFLPLLALASFLLGISYFVMRIASPYDDARLGPGEEAWLEEGVQVNPLTEHVGGLEAGDVIIALEERPLQEWAQTIFLRGEPRPSPYSAMSVSYTVLRGDQRATLQVQQAPYPLGTLFSQYWGLYALIISIQIIMTYLLLRRPNEDAARALFIFAWSLWHFPAWTMGLQVSDIVNGTGFYAYLRHLASHLAGFPAPTFHR